MYGTDLEFVKIDNLYVIFATCSAFAPLWLDLGFNPELNWRILGQCAKLQRDEEIEINDLLGKLPYDLQFLVLLYVPNRKPKHGIIKSRACDFRVPKCQISLLLSDSPIYVCCNAIPRMFVAWKQR
jgi:hypothetical protein